MGKIHIYDVNKNIVDLMDSASVSLDEFLEGLVKRTPTEGDVSLRIEECFDGKDTYFNVLFVPNVLRVDPKVKAVDGKDAMMGSASEKYAARMNQLTEFAKKIIEIAPTHPEWNDNYGNKMEQLAAEAEEILADK